MYVYRAKVERVVDGDTLDVVIDLGFCCFTKLRVRLYGVNTPEVRGESAEAGKAATSYVERWLTEHGEQGRFVMLRSHDGKPIGQEKYGRWLAEVIGADRAILNVDILTTGHGVPVNYR